MGKAGRGVAEIGFASEASCTLRFATCQALGPMSHRVVQVWLACALPPVGGEQVEAKAESRGPAPLTDPPCAVSSYHGPAAALGAALDEQIAQQDDLLVLVSPLTRALMTFQAASELGPEEQAGGTSPPQPRQWVGRASRLLFAPEVADFHPRQSRFEAKTQLPENSGRLLGRLRADPLTAVPARRLGGGRAIEGKWWNPTADSRRCVAHAAKRVGHAAASAAGGVLVFTHRRVAAALLRHWLAPDVHRMDHGALVRCELMVPQSKHARIACSAVYPIPSRPSPASLSRSPVGKPASGQLAILPSTPPPTPATISADEPRPRPSTPSGERPHASPMATPTTICGRPRRPHGAPSGIDIVRSMRHALHTGISTTEQVRDLEAFMPPISTRMHAIVVFLEGELGRPQLQGATGDTARRAGAGMEGQESDMEAEPAPLAAGIGRAVACYRTCMAERLEAQRRCRSVENAWNKGVELAVRRAQGGRWRGGFTARDEHQLTLVREEVLLRVLLVGREDRKEATGAHTATRGAGEAGTNPSGMAPVWRAWNEWVGHHELPEEDVVVIELPDGSGRGKLVAAAADELEKQRSAAGCAVDDVSVTIVASSPESALLRLSIEARWPPRWAHAVTGIIPVAQGASTSRSSTPARPQRTSPWERLPSPPRRRPSAGGSRRGRAGGGRAAGEDLADSDTHGSAGIPAHTLPSGYGAAFFAAYKQVKGRPCTLHGAARYGCIEALLDLLLPHRNQAARATSPLGRRYSLALEKEARKLQRSSSPQERSFHARSPSPDITGPPMWDSSSRSPPPVEAWSPMHTVAAESGQGLDAVDESGRTAMMHALEAGHLDCAALLLTAGADPAAGQAVRGGANALHLAAATGRVEIVRTLLRALAVQKREELSRHRAAAPAGQWHGALTPQEVAEALGHRTSADLLRPYQMRPTASLLLTARQ